MKFTELWNKHKEDFDLVFALGDRFEMAAAVAASIPFQIPIAHLHGGETTLGAIDNIYRHTISLASKYHFVTTDFFANRVKQLLNDLKAPVYNVGALSLDNLSSIKLLSIDEFNAQWKIDMNFQTILITVHPETVAYELNKKYCQEITKAIKVLSDTYQIVITMPNADTLGTLYRHSFENIAISNNKVKIIENFGTQSYFTCMKYACLLIGNTSSGIIEAATFNKYVLNLGDRQKGRLCSNNIAHLPFKSETIIENVLKYGHQKFKGENVYYKSNSAQNIIEILKNIK
jgi:GDP/UDP-N,N'-diacetylbacillosamine 2-epimerase (hydrolysing)